MTERNAVDAAIVSRRSVRGFRPDPVPEATIRELIALAGRAPSGSNIQPWKVHVVTGARSRASPPPSRPRMRATHRRPANTSIIR